jgi:hypothetical protein
MLNRDPVNAGGTSLLSSTYSKLALPSFTETALVKVRNEFHLRKPSG